MPRSASWDVDIDTCEQHCQLACMLCWLHLVQCVIRRCVPASATDCLRAGLSEVLNLPEVSFAWQQVNRSSRQASALLAHADRTFASLEPVEQEHAAKHVINHLLPEGKRRAEFPYNKGDLLCGPHCMTQQSS